MMTENSDSSEFQTAVFVGLGCLMLAVAHVVMVWTGPGTGLAMIAQRGLLDTDAYMWMNRAIHLWETGEWFDKTYPRINPPEGHEQHWTRPLDALLLIGGVALGAIWGLRDGMYFWGLALPPLLHMVTLGVLVWAVRPLLERELLHPSKLPLLLLVFLAQLGVYQVFLIGRPDHHALLALAFVAYLGYWLRLLLREQGKVGAAIGLGVVGALAIWVNVEALIFIVLGMVGLGLSWLFGNRDVARPNAVHAGTLAAGIGAAVLVEWGYPAPIRAMDTLSVAHFGLFVCTAGFWLLLWLVSGRSLGKTLRGRIGVSTVGALVTLGSVAAVFPEFFGSPLDDLDPLYYETRFVFIDEVQPLHTLGDGFWEATGRVIQFAGVGFLTLCFLPLLLLRSRDQDQQVLWITFALMVGFYLVMSFQQRRWVEYLALASMIPFTLLASYALGRMENRFRGWPLRLTRPLALIGLVMGPLMLGGGLVLLSSALNDVEEHPGSVAVWWQEASTEPAVELEDVATASWGDDCDLATVGEVLADEEWFSEPSLILAHTDHGPELLYRTKHEVLSIPNHRHQPGYHFMHAVMRHQDSGRAAELLSERGVGLLVLCRTDITSGFFWYPEDEAFAHWLGRGGVPDGFVLHAESPAVRIWRAKD